MKRLFFLHLWVAFFFLANNLFSQTFKHNQKDMPMIAWQGFGPTAATVNQFPLIRIRVLIHVIDDNSGNNNFKNVTADTLHIDSLLYKVNYRFGHLDQMSELDSEFKSSWFKNSKIQFVKMGMIFHRSNDYYSAAVNNDPGAAFNFCTTDPAAPLTTFQVDSMIHIILVAGGVGLGAEDPGVAEAYITDDYGGNNLDLMASILCHELGHCGGLIHSFCELNNFGINDSRYFSDDCDDTPTKLRGKTNNVMDYYPSSESALSEQQVGKMRWQAMGFDGFLSRCVIKTDYCVGINTTITIDSGESFWTTPRYLTGDLIIDSTAKLHIKTTVSIPPHNHIIIMPGGTLTLDSGSLLTNICGHMWGGIHLMGRHNATNDTSHQGVLYMNYATIEHADTAVSIGNSSASSGGIMNDTNSLILNCRIGFVWFPYSNGSGQSTTVIKYCNFVANSSLPGTGGFTKCFVSMVGVKGIKFQADSFINASIGQSDTVTGINSDSSSFHVSGDLYANSGGMNPCYSLDFMGVAGYFTGLASAIVLKHGGRVVIADQYFYNNNVGIMADNHPDSLHIYYNLFEIDDNIFQHFTNDTVVSVFMNASNNYDIANDSISFNGIPASSTFTSRHFMGILVFDDIPTHTITDSIHKIGTAFNSSGSALNSFGYGFCFVGNDQTIQVFCNNYTGLYYDWYLKGTSIENQCIGGNMANNHFSNPSFVFAQILDSLNNSFDYTYSTISAFTSTPSVVIYYGASPALVGIATTEVCYEGCLNSSPLRPVFFGGNRSQETYFKISPNPSTGLTCLEYQLPENEKQPIFYLYNVTGKLAFQTNLQPGLKKIDILTNDLRPGMYFYKVYGDDGMLGNGKMLVTHE